MINSEEQTEQKTEMSAENQNSESTTTIIEKCKHAQDARTVAGDEAN